MSKDKTEKKNVPAVVEPKAPVAIRITGKTKFEKDSVEFSIIKDVKGREKKIIKVGKSLVSLWIEQGKEINEFIAITEVSMRIASELLGVKREALRVYSNIANDPRMLNPELSEQLENFSQKELLALAKIDDEEVFDKALEDGHLPKSEVIDVEVDEDGNAEVADRTWAKELIEIVKNSADLATAQDNIANYTPPAEPEAEPEAEPSTDAINLTELLQEAIDFAGTEDLAEQAEELGLKKSVLKKAIADPESMSVKTIETLTEYVNS